MPRANWPCWILLATTSWLTAGVAETRPTERPGLVLEEFVFQAAPFPSCHSATFLELSNGDLLCAYFGSARERHPDVEIWLARKPVGGEWSAPVSVADGKWPTDAPVSLEAFHQGRAAQGRSPD